MTDSFWLQDLSVLYRGGRYKYFLPSPEMSKVEQLNSLSRAGLYLLILMVVLEGDLGWYYLPLVILGIAFLLYLRLPPQTSEAFEAEAKEKPKEEIPTDPETLKIDQDMDRIIKEAEEARETSSWEEVFKEDKREKPKGGPVPYNAELSVKGADVLERRQYMSVQDAWKETMDERNFDPSLLVEADPTQFAKFAFQLGKTKKEEHLLPSK